MVVVDLRAARLPGLLLIGWLAAVPVASALATELGCVIEPNRVTRVSTAVEGVLSEISVQKGDAVQRGQVVARLQSDVERASVEMAELRVAMNAQVAARKAQLDSARRKFKRSTELGDKSFISSEMLDEIRTELEVARLNYEGALENQQLAAAELERAKAQYDLRSIRSPIDGIVTERFLAEGEFAQGQPILAIASIDPLHVEVVAPVALYGTIEPGMQAIVRPEKPLDGELPAEVELVDRVVDAASGLFRIRLSLPNPDGRLPAGIECRVDFGDLESD